MNSININLENIANKDFIKVGDISRTINTKEIYGPVKKEFVSTVCLNSDGTVKNNFAIE